MTRQARRWPIIPILVLMTACASGEKADEQKAPPAPAAKAKAEIPAVAALIAHRVADYDAWKVVFDAHQRARMAGGCLGHHLNRGVDDPNMVYVYCPSNDVAKLQAFLDSSDLAEAMKRAGVEGQPEITLMKPMSEDFIPDQMLPGIIVFHHVEDYDTWRKVYDGFDEYRREHGIVGHAVDQELDDPNSVIVYHQANTIEDLRAFVDSTELKEAMERGGVVGEPDIRFVQVADFATY